MPFTPFHMGPALLLKAAAPRHFSVLVFGSSQVCIDLERLIRIVRGDQILHGFTHTLAGALVVGAGAALVARQMASRVLAQVRRENSDAWVAALLGGDISWPVAFASAWIGTGSHLLRDGIMHADMHPLCAAHWREPPSGAGRARAVAPVLHRVGRSGWAAPDRVWGAGGASGRITAGLRAVGAGCRLRWRASGAVATIVLKTLP